ncbi:MAG TPA: peptidylprolyl isomerase, partial [Candidatus Onthousia faecipullorum]|nr:peptidylprolyl isomerase [Candidatus Onthousia faecipullorum]
DFEELAKEYSDDTGSAEDGGFIDYFNKDDNMDEAFLNASIDLEEGEYTKEPVQSSFGYHIILKVDQKDKPELDEVRDDIKETLAKEKLNEDSALMYNALIEIREEAGIEFNDDSLKKDYDELMQQLIDNVSSAG